MKYRKLDENGDMMAISKGGMFEGVDAVAAAIRSRILSMRGEWWETPEEGIPFSALVGHVTPENLALTDAFVKERIVLTEGVVGLAGYSSQIVNRQRIISIVVDTVFGTTNLEVSA